MAKLDLALYCSRLILPMVMVVAAPLAFAQQSNPDIGAPYVFPTAEQQAEYGPSSKIEVRGFAPAEADPIFHQVKGEIPIGYRFIGVGSASFTSDYATADEAGRKALRDSVPTLVIINGGPAAASTGHLALDFDFFDNSKNAEKSNRLKELSKYFNIVLVDQRGQGKTIPLGENIPFDMEKASKYNNADVVAFDHVAVVQELVRKGLVNPNNWYVFGHSYGETPVWQMLKRIKDGFIKLMPKGFMVSAGSMPFGKQEAWESTRELQIKVTDAVEAWSKDPANFKEVPFKKLVIQARQKIEALERKHKIGLKADIVNLVYFYPVVGKGSKEMYEGINNLKHAFKKAETAEEVKKAYVDWMASVDASHVNFQQHMMFVEDFGMHMTDYLDKKMTRLAPEYIDAIVGWEVEARHGSPQLLELVRQGKIYMGPEFEQEELKKFLEESGIKGLVHSSENDNVSAKWTVREKLAKLIGAAFHVTTAPSPVTSHRGFYSDIKLKEVIEKAMGIKLFAPGKSSELKKEKRGESCAKGAGKA